MKTENLINGQIYTMFGISPMATTAKREFVFRGFTNTGALNVILRKLNDKGKYVPAGSFNIVLRPDHIIIPGATTMHGIYSDSEIPSNQGISFEGNALYNLCHIDQEEFEKLIIPHTTEQQRKEIAFYKMDTRGIRTSEYRRIFVDEEEIVWH